MTRPAQASFLDALTAAVIEEAEAIQPFEFDASGPECEPGSLQDVPLSLRLPGQSGYQEWDRHGRVVKG